MVLPVSVPNILKLRDIWPYPQMVVSLLTTLFSFPASQFRYWTEVLIETSLDESFVSETQSLLCKISRVLLGNQITSQNFI